VSTDPFAALGLPVRNDLTGEQVRTAWRTIAAATHPDRRDGGDIARYTAAASAYAQLRTEWGRSEAYADQVEAAAGYGYGTGTGTGGAVTAPLPAVGDDDEEMPPRPGATAARLVRAGWLLLPARIARGRPVRLALRGIAAAVMSAVVIRLIGGQPAGPAVVTGIITWFVLTGRGDLTPPPGRLGACSTGAGGALKLSKLVSVTHGRTGPNIGRI
jgi:hypothetical protein